MSSIKVTIERSIFPLDRFSVTIGENEFRLKPRELKKITLPKSDKYEVTTRLYWLKKNTTLQLTNESVIKITHGISDVFYFTGFPILSLILILSFLEIVSWFILPIISLIWLLPVLYITFLKAENYFQILTKE